MDLRVIGCHGGETPKHRTSAFILDDRLAIDAGSLTSGMDLKAQCALEACLVSHAHLDHIRDLATIADNRAQNGCAPLVIAGTKQTIAILRKHFFNGLLWPDFTKIPSARQPTIEYLVLKPEVTTKIAGYTVRAILVSHTIETLRVHRRGARRRDRATAATPGRPSACGRCLNETPNLRALLMEVSFPDSEQGLATLSGHHTPRTLAPELTKYRDPKDLPTLLYHIKPVFQAKVEREVARLKGVNLTVLQLGDQFIL